jgi:hypothetical protein
MAKRTKFRPAPGSPPTRPPGRKKRPGIVHSSVYLPEALYEGLREAAFRERCKIHDIVLEGIELALRKRGARALGAFTRLPLAHLMPEMIKTITRCKVNRLLMPPKQRPGRRFLEWHQANRLLG